MVDMFEKGESQFEAALENFRELEQRAKDQGDQHVMLEALIAQAQIYSVPSTEFNMDLGRSIVEKATQIAEEMNNKEALAKIYWISMNLDRFTQNLDRARESGEKAIALARELNMDEQLAFSLNDLAHALSMLGDLAKAKEVNLEAVQLWRKLNNLPMLADSVAGLASICIYTGEFDHAYQYSEEAYQISQNINNIWGKSYSRYAIGLVDLERGEIDLSIEHLDQTIKDARAARFTAGEMLARMFLSIVYTDLGRYDQALAVLAAGQPSSMDNLAIARAFSFGPELLMYARAGNISAAEEVAAGFDVDAEGGYFVAKYNFKLGQCYLYLAKSEFGDAVDFSEAFMSELVHSGAVFLNPELLQIIGISLMNLGQVDEARQKFEEGINLAEHLGSRRALWQLNYLLGMLHLKLHDHQEAAACFQQAKNNIQYILDHISDPDNRSSFLAMETVQELLNITERISSQGGI